MLPGAPAGGPAGYEERGEGFTGKIGVSMREMAVPTTTLRNRKTTEQAKKKA